MGCGCGRKKKSNPGGKLSSQRKSARRLKSAKIVTSKRNKSLLIPQTIERRTQKCSKCPYSVKVIAGDNKIKKCKKTNKLIKKMIHDLTLGCPANRFSSVR